MSFVERVLVLVLVLVLEREGELRVLEREGEGMTEEVKTVGKEGNGARTETEGEEVLGLDSEMEGVLGLD